MSGPKLLDKRVVTAELQLQHKQQIDLGLSIAKKVDAVRSSFEEEQSKLEEFRTHTIKRVQIEIDGFIRQKDSLIQEIRDRQEQLRQLQIPLDAKWEEVNKAQKICDEWETKLDGHQEYINREQQIVEHLKHEVELELNRTSDFKQRSSETLVLAETTLADARESAANTRNTAQAILAETELKLKLALEKEKELEEREEFVEVTRLRQEEKDIEQAMHDRTIKDKYDTLAQTIKRLEKK